MSNGIHTKAFVKIKPCSSIIYKINDCIYFIKNVDFFPRNLLLSNIITKAKLTSIKCSFIVHEGMILAPYNLQFFNRILFFIKVSTNETIRKKKPI